MYSIRGDGRRICETSLRKYAQLNFSTPMVSSSSSSPPLLPRSPSSVRAVPFVNHPRFPLPARLSSPSVLRRSPFTSSPSNSPSGLLPRPASIPLFLVAAYFFCLASLAPALGRARLYLFHPSSPPPSAPPSPRSLFCHGALVLALSHSICHPPSFHHPSKPWSLTGDTHTCARALARSHARGGSAMLMAALRGIGVVVVVRRPTEPRLHPASPPLPALLSLLFFPLATARAESRGGICKTRQICAR